MLVAIYVFEFFVPEPGFGIPYNPIENSSWNSLWWHTDAPIPSPWFKSLCYGVNGIRFGISGNGYCRYFEGGTFKPFSREGVLSLIRIPLTIAPYIMAMRLPVDCLGQFYLPFISYDVSRETYWG